MADITFAVQDPSGLPIVAAWLSASWPEPWQGLTDGDGICRVQLAPAHYDVTISHPAWMMRYLPVEIWGDVVITMTLDAIHSGQG